MKTYNVSIEKTIRLESYTMRIVANSKKGALKKYNELGFNAGVRLSSTWKPTEPKLSLSDIEEIKEKYYFMCMSCGKTVHKINKDHECILCGVFGGGSKCQ